MFHIYEGFHLVDAYHKVRHQRKYHPADGTKRALKILLVTIVTLLLWNMPSEWFGIDNLTVIQQRIIAVCHADVDIGSGVVMGHFGSHHRINAAVLY